MLQPIACNALLAFEDVEFMAREVLLDTIRVVDFLSSLQSVRITFILSALLVP